MERHDFGAAVRQLRESTAPATVGLPIGRRRVHGLRREELGELAGMSADYVRRLEQGRSPPSAGVVNAIARALRIGRAEYERLCALAGYAAADGQVPNQVGPGAMRLLERFTDTPMFVSDAAMNLIAVNSAFLALGHWDLTGDPWEWNIAWRTFCDPFDGFQQSAADATDHEAVLVAQLVGAVLGCVLANLMFDRAAISISHHHRADHGALLAEVIATLGLVMVIFGALRSGRTDRVAYAVGGYITAAYWFTSSTSFANPAVTVARMLSDSFAGIAPASVPMFVAMQVVGGGVGLGLVALLFPAVTLPEPVGDTA